MTQIPWSSGKSLDWDVTVVRTLADSYIASAARGYGEVAKLADARTCEKYNRNLLYWLKIFTCSKSY